MIKATIISILTSASILIGALMADGVVIDHNLPETIQPGEKTIVSIRINKGEVTGFAKLQLEIPAGLTARAIKKSGASFTFSGQKAKFIWMTLPDQQEFTVEYELEANATANGSKVITGQFSYIKENERIDFDVPPKVIQIGSADMAEESTSSDTVTSDTSNDTSSTASCTRTMTHYSDDQYFIELSCEGVESDGFAKFIENTPNGFAIDEDNNGEAITTVETNQIKFVWFEAPSDNSFSVSYRLSGSENKKPNIQGYFSYVSGNSPKEIPVIHQDIVDPKDFSADNSSSDSDSETDTAGSEDSNTEVQEPEVADTQTTEETPNNTTQDQTPEPEVEETTAAVETPDPETGVSYKVQLAATHKYMTGSQFKALYKFNKEVQLENHEGWTKFVTGSHEEYKEARDARNYITSSHPKFKGPFVTAYNYGDRITVQEALMITKQKWYQ